MRSALAIALAVAALLMGARFAAAQETGRGQGLRAATQGLPLGPQAAEKLPGREGHWGAASKSGSAERRSVSALSSGQRAELHRAIMGSDIHRADRVGYSLSAGTRVPDGLRIYDVPESIAAILPQFRGFKYIVVQGELIIVDPNTLEVAAVLPV